MRYAARTDGNSSEIVSTLRALGAEWFDMSRVAQWIPGFPDGMAVIMGQTYLVELKQPNGRLTEDQISFMTAWRGQPIAILKSAQEAAAWVQQVRKRAMS